MSIAEGWYPDPDGKPSERYWDGNNWTEQTRPLIAKPSNPQLPAKAPSELWKSKPGGCIGWTILIVIALIMFSCVTGSDDDKSTSTPAVQETDNAQGKESQSSETEYESLVDWINGNDASSYFDKLAALSFSIGDAANNLDIDKMTELMDEMAFIGMQMKMIKPSPDPQFNEYWSSIYTDLIEIGTYTPKIRALDAEAVEAATITIQKMTATTLELNEYLLPILVE